ncbi:16S rRNA (cytosine(967)-C(5))-methyltransferase RsmB [Hydrogenophilus islandicus]
MKHEAQGARRQQDEDSLAAALEQAAAIVAAVIAGQSATDAWEAAKRRELERIGWGRVQDFAWSTLRDYGWGDAVLAAMSRREVDTRLRPLLLVALTELRKGRVPVHALIFETVALAKAKNPAWGGFVNALLRRFDRERSQWVPEVFRGRTRVAQEARWRYPLWWIERIRRDYPATWQTVLESGNGLPPMGLRVRDPKKRPEVIAILAEAEVAAEPHPELAGAIWLPKPVAAHRLPPEVQRACVIQDIGAQWAAEFLTVHPGERVLDACAAPGGKALHLLDSAAIELTVVEKEEGRFRAMLERFPELGTQARAIHGDAATPNTWWDGRPFDAILLDAPCSASGVVRRHPDIKWLRRESDLAALAQAQQALLTALWPLLRPGGRLLYVTCSLFAEENDDQIAAFLATHSDAVVHHDARTGVLLPTPQSDGFFYARIDKRG